MKDKLATYINVEDAQHSLYSKYYCRQPDGYSCGATSIKIISNIYGIKSNITDLKTICGTNPQTGTIDSGIVRGLNFLGLPYHRTFDIIFNTDQDEIYLNYILYNDFSYVMRTLIHGMKHWVVIVGKSNDYYSTLDPAFGIINYHKSFILEAHKLRDYDGFVVLKEKKLKKS